MTDFPALGFDPCPGSVETVDALARTVGTVASRLEEANQAVRVVSRASAEWQGEASESFADTAGELPEHLERAAQSLYLASKALSRWAGELTALQRRAQSLEMQAEQARRRLAAAEANAPSAYDLQARQVPLDEQQALIAARDRASVEYESLVAAARRLQEEHQDTAGNVECAIRNAADEAPDAGFLGWIGDQLHGAWDWLDDRDRLIGPVGDVLGDVSAICGVLGLAIAATGVGLPLAGVLEGIAVSGSGLALIAHGVAKAGGNDDVGWDDLGGDALGVVTFGVAKLAQREIKELRESRLEAVGEETIRELRRSIRDWRRMNDVDWLAEQGQLVVDMAKAALKSQYRELWDSAYWAEVAARPDTDPIGVPASAGAAAFWCALEAPSR